MGRRCILIFISVGCEYLKLECLFFPRLKTFNKLVKSKLTFKQHQKCEIIYNHFTVLSQNIILLKLPLKSSRKRLNSLNAFYSPRASFFGSCTIINSLIQ